MSLIQFLVAFPAVVIFTLIAIRVFKRLFGNTDWLYDTVLPDPEAPAAEDTPKDKGTRE